MAAKRAPKRAKVGTQLSSDGPPPRPQETLTCAQCGQDWQRPITKGKKPQRCSDCAAQPRILTDDEQAELEARRKLFAEQNERLRLENAERTVDELMRGMEVIKNKEPRNYSLTVMLDRIEALEAQYEKLAARMEEGT